MISCPQTRRTQGASKRFASFPSTSQKRHSKRYPYPQRAKRGPAPDNWLSTSNLPRSLWLGTPPMLDRGYGNFSERRKSEVQLRRIPLPKLFGNSQWIPNRGSESGQEGSKESRSAASWRHRRVLDMPSAIFQTVSPRLSEKARGWLKCDR